MIALTTAAFAREWCPEPPRLQLAAAPDLWDLWGFGPHAGGGTVPEIERIDPSWSGTGWDQQALFGLDRVGRCARIGVREEVIWHNVSDDTGWGDGRWRGSEWSFVTSPMLGGEVALPAWFGAGMYALPGVRSAVTHQVATVRGLDASDTHVSFVPTLSAYAVVRWIPARLPVGLHVDVELPLLAPWRETTWYPHRFLGAGLDLRLSRPGG